MKIVAARFYRVTLPFRSSYRHHLAERSENETVVLRLRSEEGCKGLGECIPRSYLTGESVSDAEEALNSSMIPDLIGREFSSWPELVSFISRRAEEAESQGRLAAFAAVDLALVDLWARCQKLPVAEVLGGILRREFRYSGPIGAGDRWKTIRRALMFRAFGFRQIKFKVGFEGDIDLLKTVRRILGPGRDIRVDANCAWDREQAARRIEEMSGLGISCVEQPLPAGDLDGLAWLVQRSELPIMADESLTGMASARALCDLPAPVLFNVRLAKCGGYINSLKMIEMARESGAGWQLGCLVGETGILSMAGRHLAAATGDYRYLEGSYGPYFLKHDIVKGRVGFGLGGVARLVPEPGLGIVLHRGAIKRFCEQTSETELRAGCPEGHRSA